MNRLLGTLGLSLLATSFATPLTAAALDNGERRIYLVDKLGEQIDIGSLNIINSVAEYELHVDHAKFADYFLSMKEMKCLEGPELWCHIPYPYKHPARLSSDDLSWLSHDLLFMFKSPGEFGANFWNGIYYNLELVDGVITGEAQAVDLNHLASPPDDLSIPPYGEYDRDELDLTARWLPRIEIR